MHMQCSLVGGALGVSDSVCRLLCKARFFPSTPLHSSHCCQQTIDWGENERVRERERDTEGASLQHEKNINSNWSERPIRVRSMECLLWQRIQLGTRDSNFRQSNVYRVYRACIGIIYSKCSIYTLYIIVFLQFPSANIFGSWHAHLAALALIASSHAFCRLISFVAFNCIRQLLWQSQLRLPLRWLQVQHNL